MKVEFTGSPEHVVLQGKPKEMLTVRTEADGTLNVKINSSSLSILQECWRKSYYSLVRQLKSNVEGPATLYGTAIHKALEVFYSGHKEERKLPDDFTKTVELMGAGAPASPLEEAALPLRAIRAFLDAAAPLSALPASDKRSHATGAWTLEHYFRTYVDDPYVILRDAAGAPMGEKIVECEVWREPGLAITLFGTIDCILRNEENGTVLVTDHKTSSVVGEQFYNRLKPNHQYTGYLVLAQRVLGLDTNAFMVNCIQVKAKPVTSRGTPPNFPRQVTTRSEEDIAEFIMTLRYYVRQFLELRAQGDGEEHFPLGHVSTCASYNGCQYLKVCGAPSILRENILEAEFNKPLAEGE